ncbi:MAG TPA: ABC transporter ATP-binding protein [Anaerolineae bacterium]
MGDFAVEMRDVVKEFPGAARGSDQVLAVDHVTLQIRDGEFFSLLGPSGCGKTTSLRMIAGFELPTGGEIYLHGKPVGRTPPFQRPVNTVFQNYALFPHMSIGANVAFGLQMKRVSKTDIEQRVKEALDMVRLPGYEKRRPRQMSGGQQQRVALARALVNRPEVLLLDEPLGALDLKLRKEMQLELKTLQREVGITFIYVTHDQEEALTMSDRIAVMDHGRVLQAGTSLDIYEAPNCRFVADFIGETNFISGTLVSVNGQEGEFQADGLKIIAMVEANVKPGMPATLAVRPERVRLTPTAPGDTPNAFVGEIVESIYIGTDTRFAVHLTPTVSVRVRRQNVEPIGMPALEGPTGVKVWVSWHPESARVLAS